MTSATREDEQDLWSNQDYEGEPDQWDTSQLSAWLHAHKAGFTSGMGWRFNRAPPASGQQSKQALLCEVLPRIEQLYAAFKPVYQAQLSGLDVARLPAWAPGPAIPPPDFSDLPFAAIKRYSQPLERRFNSAVALHEKLQYHNMAVPMGLHPLDDLRQNHLLICRAVEGGKGHYIYMMDGTQTEACQLSVRDIRLALPGGKLKTGSQAVVVRQPLAAAASAASVGSGDSGGGGSSGAADPLEHLYGQTVEVQGPPQADGYVCVRVGPPPPSGDASTSGQGSAAAQGEPLPLRVDMHGLLLLKAPTKVKGMAAHPEVDRLLQPGDAVVLRGLVKRPELNGRVGMVLDAPPDKVKGGRGGGGRCRVHLFDWRRPLGAVASATWAGHADTASATEVRAQTCNVVAVAEPPPVLVVAYASHRDPHRPDVSEVMDRGTYKLAKRGEMIRNIRCTLREMLMFKRTLAGAALSLEPPQVRELLGDLDPKLWRLSIITPTKPPATPEEIAKQQLRNQRCCRRCGAAGVKLSLCTGCKSAAYCSRSCQAADWKARHRTECKPAAGGEATAAADSGSGQLPAPSLPAACDGGNGQEERVQVELVGALGAGAATSWIDVSSGHYFDSSQLPKNIHGDAEFVVKVQNGFNAELAAAAALLGAVSDAVMYSNNIGLYDEPKSFNVNVFPDVRPATHAALVRALKSHGQPGVLNAMGHKVYLYARRRGAVLDVVVAGRMPPQQQRW